MKFTGQVRIPDVDHPGVPATFLIDGDQAEVFLEGETLGRWSLFDMHTSRLVSAAFLVKAGNQEVTFIADEPVDFAYKGVEHMAEVWARFKAMTIPRRLIAVKSSRRGTKPSRIPELRDVMLQNLENRYKAPSPEAPEVISAPEPVSVPEPVETVADPPRPVERPAVTPTAPPAARLPLSGEAAPPRPVLRPGPGLFARTDSVAPNHPVPEEVVEEQSIDPVVADQPDVEEVAKIEEVVEEIEATEPAASAEQVPELVKEFLGTSAGEAEGDRARDLVVDLGEFEEGAGPDSGSAPEPDSEPELQPAVSTGAEADKSGLFGAVRSAFVRNKSAHVHEFVEAPGGIGIVRQICNECGYVSIGVSD